MEKTLSILVTDDQGNRWTETVPLGQPGQHLKLNAAGDGYEWTTLDLGLTSHSHANLTALDNVTGTNTGDQNLLGYQQTSQKGQANGYASLGADGKVPSAQLPSSSGQAVGLTTLANGTTALALATNINVKVTPTATATLTTTVPPAGTRCSVLILTSGTTPYTLTFGSGFKSVGTLVTGTTTARVFVVNFISDGTNLYETGRTAAMVA